MRGEEEICPGVGCHLATQYSVIYRCVSKHEIDSRNDGPSFPLMVSDSWIKCTHSN